MGMGGPARMSTSFLTVPFPSPLEAEVTPGLAPRVQPQQGPLGKEFVVCGTIVTEVVPRGPGCGWGCKGAGDRPYCAGGLETPTGSLPGGTRGPRGSPT